MSPQIIDELQKKIMEVNTKERNLMFEQGIEQGEKNTIRKLKKYLDVHEISKITGLSVEDIEKL